MIVGRRKVGQFERLGRWDGTVQCIDSACASSLRFRPHRTDHDRQAKRRLLPRQADTLRVVIYGRRVEGAEIALGPVR